nr:multidrug and toxin extrusion protein 2-like [Pan troglodytes]
MSSGGLMSLWSGLIVCVFFQALFYLVYILRINWNKVVEQAQVQAGLKGNKETMPTSSDLPILGREVTDGIILPDIIRPESQTPRLMRPEENTQYAMSTAGEVLTVRQLIFYHGMALALAVTFLSAGIFIKSFQ